MLTPAYKVTVGKKVVDTTDEPKASTLVELRVDLDMDTPADRFAMVLGQVDGLHPAPGDTAVVELGYADDSGSLKQVIKGTVVTVEPGLIRNRVIGYTSAQALLHHFDNKSFEIR